MTEFPWEFDRYGYCSKVMGGSAFALHSCTHHMLLTLQIVCPKCNHCIQSKSLQSHSSEEEVLISLNKPGTTQKRMEANQTPPVRREGMRKCEVQMHALFPPNHALQKED